MSKYTYMSTATTNHNVQKYLDEHYPRHEYTNLVDGLCKSCGRKLTYDIKRYELRGNYCFKCDAESRTRAQYLKTQADLDKAFQDLFTTNFRERGEITPPALR